MGKESKYIVTVPRLGYRFATPVRQFTRADKHVEAESREFEEPVIQHSDQGGSHTVNRRWYGAALVAVLLLTGFWSRKGAHPARVNAIAVLPFEHLGDAGDDECFSDGLTEDVISALNAIPGLHVFPRTTAFQFKGKAGDIRAIGRQLGVGAVLEGSVRRQNHRLRVTARLSNVDDRYPYWSRAWDREDKNVFVVQDEIARGVATSLRSPVTQPPALIRAPTENLEPYKLYLQGRFYSRRVFTSMDKAIGFFRQAIQADPNFAAAYAGLSDAYAHLGYSNQIQPREAFAEAKAAVRKALALDPSSSLAHAINAWIYACYDWDWKLAQQEFRRAIELNAAETEAAHWYSDFLVAMRRFDESLEQSRRAVELDPLDASKREHLGWHCLMSRDSTKAISEFERALELDPSNKCPLLYLTQTSEDASRFDEAIRAIERRGESQVNLSGVAEALRSTGARGYWRAQIEHELAESGKKYIGVRRIARAYARLGESRQAVAWLRRGVEQRDPFLIYLKIDPAYDVLRVTPEFQALVRQMNIP